MRQAPDIIISADWSKRADKRAVYTADVQERLITRLESPEWSLEHILCIARSHQPRSVLVSMDLALGVPLPYWRDVLAVERYADAVHFMDWLAMLKDEDSFWPEVKSGEEWSVVRPFFSVPGGPGSMTAFDNKAGYSLLREVDSRFQAKRVFCVSGIPGTVGSGTRALWQELTGLLGAERDFHVWPFEGSLDHLLSKPTTIIAEGYPAIAYTVALRDTLPARRLKVAKTKHAQRRTALDRLTKARWVGDYSVAIHNFEEAEASEDDFDALMGAAALLRCVLEGYDLDEPSLDDPIAEGAVLLTSTIDLEQRAEMMKV